MLKDIFNQKTKKNGQVIVGVALVIIVLAGLLFFILSVISPSTDEPPPGFTGLSDEAVQKLQDDIRSKEENSPIAGVLPYGGPLYDQSFFIHSPLEDGTILVDIDSAANFEEEKNATLDWIRLSGHNPDDYSFNFRIR